MKKILTWGAFSISLGLLTILITIILEDAYKPLSHFASIFIILFGHIGVALISIGLIGIIVDFRDWQEYFRERIAQTIVHRDYLNTLDKTELISLQTDTMKAFFKDEDIARSEGFLDFFQSKIQGYIGSPYREGTRKTISIELIDNNQTYLVEETTSYRCRKVRDSIQDHVGWTSFKDTLIRLKEYKVTVEIPKNFYQSPDFKSPYPNMDNGRKIYDTEIKDGELVSKVDGLERAKEGQGFTLSLTDFKDIDGLYIEINFKYVLPSNMPFSWMVQDPAKGLIVIVNYPQDQSIDVATFGIDERDGHEQHRQGLYTFEYDSWLLPNSGYTFHLLKKQEQNREVANTEVLDVQ